jgi:hypothetical protein
LIYGGDNYSDAGGVRAKLPAEACSVSLVCEGAEGAAHQAYAACRSGSA